MAEPPCSLSSQSLLVVARLISTCTLDGQERPCSHRAGDSGLIMAVNSDTGPVCQRSVDHSYSSSAELVSEKNNIYASDLRTASTSEAARMSSAPPMMLFIA